MPRENNMSPSVSIVTHLDFLGKFHVTGTCPLYSMFHGDINAGHFYRGAFLLFIIHEGECMSNWSPHVSRRHGDGDAAVAFALISPGRRGFPGVGTQTTIVAWADTLQARFVTITISNLVQLLNVTCRLVTAPTFRIFRIVLRSLRKFRLLIIGWRIIG